MSDLAASSSRFSDSEFDDPAAAPHSSNQGVFFGRDGLRAGWGILLFLLLAALAFIGFSIAVQVQHLMHPTAAQLARPLFTPVAQLVEAALYILAVVGAAVVLARRRAFSSAKAAIAGLLLFAAVALLTLSIVHQVQLQHEKAATKQAAAAATDSKAKDSQASGEGKSGEIKSTSSVMGEVQALTGEAAMLAVVMFVTWLMSRIEHRPFGQYGLGGNSRRWPQLAQGLVVGFGALSLLIGILYLGHWIRFGGRLLHGPVNILGNGLIWLAVFVLVGFFEEFFFRGYLQYTLARGIGLGAIGFFVAAALFNFSFGFVHGSNPGESPIGLFTAGLIGFVFCISLWYTRSLWWAIGFHATWDWGESYFYGTADSGGVSQGRLLDSHPQGQLLLSGGATGPEGSAICLGIIVLIALIVWLTLRREHNKSTNQALVNPLLNAPQEASERAFPASNVGIPGSV